MSNDPIMDEIQMAIATLQAGDRRLARERLGSIWARIQPNPGALRECTLAHFMADAQDDLREELNWDIRALAAADRCSEAEARRYHENLSIAEFLPSLHLNLGDVYLRLGDQEASRFHLDAGLASSNRLVDDAYASMIRSGLERLAQRLENAGQLRL